MVEQNKSNASITVDGMAQWTADNERLVLAGLSNIGPELFDYDVYTLDAVRLRCIQRFGNKLGTHYYQTLIATFPERHKELFPEIFG